MIEHLSEEGMKKGYLRGKINEIIDHLNAEKAERCPEIEFVYGKEASAKGQGITLMYHKELRTIIAFKPKHKGLAKDSFDEGKLSTSGEDK